MSITCRPWILVGFILAASAIPAAGLLPEVTGRLPNVAIGASAFWDADDARVYILGLDEAESQGGDDILRYDPATGITEVLQGKLPSARWGGSAVWTGHDAYYFGGNHFDGFLSVDLDQILRFTPSTGQVTVMNAKLPPFARAGAAVWDGARAYVFTSSAVLRYDPGADALTAMGAYSYGGSDAVWFGNAAYVVGVGIGNSVTDAIVRFDPVGDATSIVAHLPSARGGVAAVAAGDYVLLLGGVSCCTNSTKLDEIVRFEPSTGTVVTIPDRLPFPNDGPASAKTSDAILLFGGWPRATDIVTWRGMPSDPQSLDPEATLAVHVTGSSLGLGMHLRWDAPASEGWGPITGHKVFWSIAPGDQGQLIATLGDVHEYTHRDADPLHANYYSVIAANAFGEGPAARVCALTYPWAVSPLLTPPSGGCEA